MTRRLKKLLLLHPLWKLPLLPLKLLLLPPLRLPHLLLTLLLLPQPMLLLPPPLTLLLLLLLTLLRQKLTLLPAPLLPSKQAGMGLRLHVRKSRTFGAVFLCLCLLDTASASSTHEKSHLA